MYDGIIVISRGFGFVLVMIPLAGRQRDLERRDGLEWDFDSPSPCNLPVKVSFEVRFNVVELQGLQRIFAVLNIAQQGSSDGDLASGLGGNRFLATTVPAPVRATCGMDGSAEIISTADLHVLANEDVNGEGSTAECEPFVEDVHDIIIVFHGIVVPDFVK